MYLPSHFKEEDAAYLYQAIREIGFGMLTVSDDDGVEVNHVPFLLIEEGDAGLARLQCHVARGNPVWRRIQHGANVLVVFQGPHAYVSPSWYPSKGETGKVVPTWNYLAVHAKGAARVIEESSWLKRHVADLTYVHEEEMPEPWSVEDAPSEYTGRLLRAIVGIELQIESLVGKRKASQNQTLENKAGVKKALGKSENEQARSVAEYIR